MARRMHRRIRGCEMTFNDYAAAWLQKTDGAVKPSSRAQYEYLIHMMAPILSGEKLEAFTNVRLQRLADTLSERLSRQSVANALVFVRMILRDAMRTGEIPFSVFDRIRIRAEKSHNDRPCLTSEEFDRLTGYCQEHPDERGTSAIMLALYAGLRIGEIAALTYEDMSFRRNTIAVNRTRQRIYSYSRNVQKSEIHDGTPKSATSRRIIPMAKTLRHFLEAARSAGI